MNFSGKVVQQRQVDLGLGQVDELQADLLAHRPQGRLFGDQPQLDGRLVQPHAVGLGRPRQLQLPGVQEPFAQQDFASFHDGSRPAGGGAQRVWGWDGQRLLYLYIC